MKKHYSIFIALALFTTACVHQSGYDGYQTEKNHESVLEFFKAFNKHDFKLMASFYADSAKFLDPSFGKEYIHKTQAETAAKYTALTRQFPNVKDSTTNIITAGDHVTAQFISTGTAADGKAFSLPIVTVFTFKGGKIITDATYYDTKM